MIEIIPLGGYSEVGRNCVAVKVDDEVFILDMGLMIDKYIEYTEKEEYDQVKVSGKKLIEIGAAPDVNILGKDKKNVKAILITHAHLDHIGAIPYIANKVPAPVYATPFTAKIIETITRDEKLPLRSELVVKTTGKKFKLTKKVSAEFVHVTHSTPDTATIVLHTPYGQVVYANDFKLDEHPTKGERTDTKRLGELDNVQALIFDALYATKDTVTKSENHARAMLFNVLSKEQTEGKIVLATTFSSHIYRLQTFMEVAARIGRRPVFLGRSLAKYIQAAQDLGIADFSHAEIVPYGGKVRSALKRIKDPHNCLFVSTGNQGEPKAALSKIIKGNWLPFQRDDMIVFSCITIPVEPNIHYREELETEIKDKGMEVLKDIHVSGHGTKHDHKKLIELVKPKNIIPTHAGLKELFATKELAIKLGFSQDKIHILQNGEKLRVDN